MLFIKRSAAIINCILVCAVLAACGSFSELPEGWENQPWPGEDRPPPTGDDTAAAQGAGASPTDPLAIPTNPYELNRQAVSAAAQAEFERGVRAMRAQDWAEAERIFAAMSGDYPKLSGPKLNRGIAAWQLGDLELAQNSFNQAIKVNPANQEAYNQLALIYREQGSFEESERTYLSAIKVWPGYPSIRRNLGVLYDLYLGNLSAALVQFKAYQSLLAEPDKTVSGWIIDLQRRIDAPGGGA